MRQTTRVIMHIKHTINQNEHLMSRVIYADGIQ